MLKNIFLRRQTFHLIDRYMVIKLQLPLMNSELIDPICIGFTWIDILFLWLKMTSLILVFYQIMIRLNQARNACDLNMTTKEEEEEEEEELHFTFSPLASVLSSLPPSPQSYRKVRNVNKDQSTESNLFWWLCLVLFTWIYFLMPKLIND